MMILLRDLRGLALRLKNRIPFQPAVNRSEPGRMIDPGRRLFMSKAVNFSMLSASSVLGAAGFFEARRPPQLERVPVPISGLHSELAGFRIVQISDLHIGPTIRRDYIRQVVQQVNALEPDLIAMTGDLIDGYIPQLAPHVEPLKDLKAKHGSFFVTGNHEYYWGAEEWMEEIEKLGFSILQNEHRMIARGPARLMIAGIPDHDGERLLPSHGIDPVSAKKGGEAADCKILLAHQPRSCYPAQAAGYDLQLSGHTHGGQFVPWNYVVRLQQPYISGLHDYKGMWVYVSRGTGYWGPPLRLGIPSEITELTLVGV